MATIGNFCEIVSSSKGHPKLVVNGYLMTKDKNRNDLYYWCCEKRKTLKCRGYATTINIHGQHMLRSTTEHNHAPDASQKHVAIVRAAIKRKAHETRDNPAQILQDESNNIPESSQPSLPNRHALRQVIKRARKEDMPPQPTDLNQIEIPVELRSIDETPFFIKDSIFNEERILLFSTPSNFNHLKNSEFWIMDGTFKVVPALFRQLYTIHGNVGTGDNKRVMPLVYALMTSKSQECYTKLFQEILDYASDINIELNPPMVLSDFEQASVNAFKGEFPNTISKGCFFHLGQSVWRQVQACGLSKKYGDDAEFSLKIRMIPALAFLPPSEIPAAFLELKSSLPEEVSPISTWFEENYVIGRRRRGRGGTSQPLYPPHFWSVTEQMDNSLPRTQNKVEAWHRRLESLIGKAHVGVYTLISEIRKEQMQVNRRAEDILRGLPASPTKKIYIDREKRLKTVYNDKPNRTRMDFLRGIAHSISL